MRVQAALLTGAENLTVDFIALVANVPRRRVVLMLAELEAAHMLACHEENGCQFYGLTPYGRKHAIAYTGLAVPDYPERGYLEMPGSA